MGQGGAHRADRPGGLLHVQQSLPVGIAVRVDAFLVGGGEKARDHLGGTQLTAERFFHQRQGAHYVRSGRRRAPNPEVAVLAPDRGGENEVPGRRDAVVRRNAAAIGIRSNSAVGLRSHYRDEMSPQRREQVRRSGGDIGRRSVSQVALDIELSVRISRCPHQDHLFRVRRSFLQQGVDRAPEGAPVFVRGVVGDHALVAETVIDDAGLSADAAIDSLALLIQAAKRGSVAQVHGPIFGSALSELNAYHQQVGVVRDSMHPVAQLCRGDQAADRGSVRPCVANRRKGAGAARAGP